MASKGVILNRLSQPLGSKYLSAADHTEVNCTGFVAQEDTTITLLEGGDASVAATDVDYKASMNLDGVTLKRGAFITSPAGEAFQNINISAGSVLAYNSIIKGEKPGFFVGLLDLYPNAAAAYSLRKLRTDYSGFAIRVRVDTIDNLTYDIGFDSNGELDTDDLISKAAGNSAYVSRWYDQSGQGNDATQDSADKQPQIVSSGVVIEVNNFSAVDFDGTNDFLETATFTEIEQPTSYFSVFKFDSNRNQNIFDSGNTLARQQIGDNGTNYKFYGGISITGGTTNTNQNSISGFLSDTDSLFVNNISVVSGDAGDLGIDKIIIASNVFKSAAFLDGKIQELILYPLDQSTNKNLIETNINDYYDVY